MNDGYLLSGEAQMAEIARDAANLTLSLGAQEVMVSAIEMAGITMRARGGRFDSAVREGGQTVTIKVFDGGRAGTATTSALTRAALNLAAERAIAIARAVEPDPDTAPAEEAWLAREVPALELFAPSSLSAQDLGRVALEIEAAGAEAGLGSVRIAEAGAASLDACSALAIGRDFDRSLIGSRQDIWCMAIAERDGAMVQDHWSSADRRLSQLLPCSIVGRTAADRALRKLGGRTLDTQNCAVLMDAPVAASLVYEIVGALSGRAQFEGATFLAADRRSPALASHLDLMEDPFEPFGLSSGVCDSEGVASHRRMIIAGGQVQGLFLSCLHARKLGRAPTGSADGPRNLHLSSQLGAEPLEEMLRQLGRGLWVTELIGGAVDPVSGAYSKAVAGFWVEGGEIAFPVQDITVAGDLPAMLQQIVAIGGDVHRSGAARTGSVLIESMRISGR